MADLACTCGRTDSHCVAFRQTADGYRVEVWSDGAVTGGLGYALPGVPVARPRTPEARALELSAAWLFAGEIELYDLGEAAMLHRAVRLVAKRGGVPGDVRAEMERGERPSLRLVWQVYERNSRGDVMVRVARLDRMRWPGLHVWYERGRYEILAETTDAPCGVRLSGPSLKSTGFRFETLRELTEHLLTVSAVRHASVIEGDRG